MANSREAQFKRDTIEGRTLHGWQVVADYGYDHEGEEASKLDLTYYHLTKRE
ncbi:hypothetical protein L0636_09010 [Halomonas janggokensis]|uniref:Uncharacterized protein n=1 Tax=Vreelandella janggokensis TaxID=370767 RepID=A0ABT4IWB7_9GAMM|nr:hypothetical protein [Halomonas janggokensis]MCZ0927975.1 hypothetical protein [Halomonas janggokensis]MCZ0930567.1 hypothetical protein [Halomonas janggokensis]